MIHLLIRVDISSKNEKYAQSLLKTVQKNFQEYLLVECGWFTLCGCYQCEMRPI